jgi:hypothetical protein
MLSTEIKSNANYRKANLKANLMLTTEKQIEKSKSNANYLMLTTEKQIEKQI